VRKKQKQTKKKATATCVATIRKRTKQTHKDGLGDLFLYSSHFCWVFACVVVVDEPLCLFLVFLVKLFSLRRTSTLFRFTVTTVRKRPDKNHHHYTQEEIIKSTHNA
jgi:hypothetical protein